MLTRTEPREVSTSCRADEFQRLVGMSHSELLRVRILGPVRVIRPGMAVTTDFSATRLNIALDESETVTRVFCG
ncbi:MAG: I78 family peptidase inhibitor [Pseudomonadota bacterium]